MARHTGKLERLPANRIVRTAHSMVNDMTKIERNGISLSAGAVLNGWPAPVPRKLRFEGRGDFAEREGGRIRRNDRRNRIAAKRSWLHA